MRQSQIYVHSFNQEILVGQSVSWAEKKKIMSSPTMLISKAQKDKYCKHEKSPC